MRKVFCALTAGALTCASAPAGATPPDPNDLYKNYVVCAAHATWAGELALKTWPEPGGVNDYSDKRYTFVSQETYKKMAIDWINAALALGIVARPAMDADYQAEIVRLVRTYASSTDKESEAAAVMLALNGCQHDTAGS